MSFLLVLVGASCVEHIQPEAGTESEPEEKATLGPPQEPIAVTEEALLEQTVDPRPEIAVRANARLGLLYADQERWDEAERHLRGARGQIPILDSYLAVREAEVLSKTGRHDEALALLKEVESASAGSSSAIASAIARPVVLGRAGRIDEANESARALRTIPVNEFTDERLIQAADEMARSGAYSGAQAVRAHILLTYPESRYTERLYDHLVEQGGARSSILTLGWEESVALADSLARVNRFPEALDFIERTRRRFPGRGDGSELKWIEARSLFHSRQYRELQQLSVPESSPRAPTVERLVGHAAWRLDRTSEFLRRMQHILESHPESDEVQRVRLLLAKYWMGEGRDADRAAEMLGTLIESGDAGEDGENYWLLIWNHISEGEPEAAIGWIDRYLEEFPSGSYATNALFWKGKLSSEEAARSAAWDQLVARFPYSYYAWRVREITGLGPPPGEIARGEEFPEGPRDERILEELGLIEELDRIGLNDEAARQFRELVGSNPDDQWLAYRMADRYAAAGEPLRAMIILNRSFSDLIRHGGRKIPRRFWEILYPLHWREEIEEAAAKAEISPWLMAGITRQESGWDPSIVSGAGAAGLMQIMPREVAHLGRKAGFDRPLSRDDLFDPRINIALGAVEIVDKLAAMDGNLKLAIASYNAGQGSVRRWLRDVPAEDIDFFIESIPFNETRRYVMAVTRNQHEYERLYGSEGSRSG